MKWTERTPTEEGFYWIKYTDISYYDGSNIDIVCIVPYDDTLVAIFFEDPSYRDLTDSCFDGCLWYGPIQAP